MSEEQDEFRPRSAGFYARLGASVIAVLFGGVALWSVLAPIEGAIIAGGQVVVESNRKTVQHLEGGVVASIQVREGDFAEKGEVLVQLDTTMPLASAALIDNQLTELYARRARLEAERNASEKLEEPRGVIDLIESAVFQENIEGQKQLFVARRITHETQVELLEERIVQQSERINGLNAQVVSLRDQVRLINDELEGVRTLHDEGYAPKTRLRALERESKRLNGERGALKAGIAEAESAIAEANLEIERLKKSGREEAITELRDVEASISELEERRTAAQDTLRRTEIRAPQSGRVLALAVHTIGGVIAPGEPLMDIVPEGDPLEIAARIEPQDVDRIVPGQETLVRFSAFGSRQTPEAIGTVKTVSADAMTDPVSGIPFFSVVITIPDEEKLATILSGRRLLPGMPVEAYIKTGSQPAISYLLKPITDSMKRSLREE